MGVQPVIPPCQPPIGGPIGAAGPRAVGAPLPVPDLQPVVTDEDVPGWVRTLPVPSGWLTGRYVGSGTARPWRVIAAAKNSHGGWDLCETLTVFRYRGSVGAQFLRDRSDHALRSAGGRQITHSAGPDSAASRAWAMSSWCDLDAGAAAIRVRMNSFAVEPGAMGAGYLVEQCLFVDATIGASAAVTVDGLTLTAFRAFAGAAADR